ncbi:phage portal protein [Bacillus sp. Bos-x628]|uniref:phage portal protein n=1 Tax=Bacillus maqinnsis TaxID=3229854 RepID=UPI00338ED591
MNEFLQHLRKSEITGEVIQAIIDAHKEKRSMMISQYERYKASIEGVPILRRDAFQLEHQEDFETGAILRIDDRVNNRLNNGFDSEIVDTKIGYMFGHPITYEVDKNKVKSNALEEAINRFNLLNTIEDADSELGKKAAICGYATRLAYVDKSGEVRTINIDPWEVAVIGNNITEPEYALRYYEVTTWIDGKQIKRDKAEFYDSSQVYYFEKLENGWTLVDILKHLFDHCPLFGLPNNDELMGDAEKVYSLIDAYDRTLSDASNEIEQLRLAYIIFKGAGADEETLENLKKHGVFELFGENDDVKFLTKDINDTMIENHLNRLEENIMRFSKSVNFSDEAFGGNLTGVAMRYKLMALENKCITMERKMTAALRYQYKLLCSAWSRKNAAIRGDDYLKVWFTFTRNLPANIAEEAETTAKLKGLVSEETRLSLLTFVDDVQYELDRMNEEKIDSIYSFDEEIETEPRPAGSREKTENIDM